MFSWICPKCGREVPPSYSDCPNCSPEVAQATATSRPAASARTAPPPPPPPPVYKPVQHQSPAPSEPAPAPAPPPVATPSAQVSTRPPKRGGVLFNEEVASTYQPPPYTPPPSYPPLPQQQQPPAYPPPAPQQPSGLPSWLLMALVALVVGGIVAGAVWFKRNQSDETTVADEPKMTVESAPATTSSTHRYSKFVELSGFRVSEDARRRANVKMAVTNHSTADLGGLALIVTLKTSQGKEIGTSNVTVASLGPQETVEVTAPLKTNLRAYELPDWQFIRAEFQITSK